VKGNQVFTFPEGFRLGKGKTVTITSGPKAYEDSPSVLKWTFSTIWNNDGDPAELLDDKGRLSELTTLRKFVRNFTDGISWLILNS